jgi:hypothetical protein
LFIFFEVNIMSRFSRVFARGSSIRFASITTAAVMFASLLMFPNSAHAQGLLQAPSANLTTGTTPQGVAAADFNRSGWTGLVIANSNVRRGASSISVYLGTGPNTFNGGNTYNVCEGPTAVLATDINHDGYPDIIVACTGDATIDVLFNTGTGTFGTATSYTLSGNPVALIAGDFVGNGHVDVAAADSNGNVSVLLNTTGSGTFSSSHIVLSGAFTGIAAGDFNKDGYVDLAVSDSTNSTVHVLTNNGSGVFTQHGTYTAGNGTKPSDVVAADFNHDGNLDVATSNASKNTASILLGNGDGSLAAPTTQATGTDPIALVATDVDSDGNQDLVVFDSPTSSTGQIDVLLGNGNGTLQAAQSNSETFEPGTQADVADFNRDGKPDIALVQQDNNRASVLLNNTMPTQYPDGRSFANYNPLSIGMGNFADGVAVGDFNKDGKLDIAVSYLQDNDVKVLFGNGSGSFSTGATYAVGTQPFWIASGDFNGDGYPDLVTSNTNINGANGTISVLLNNKNGTFASATTYTVGNQPYQVAVGDVNGDGYADLAVANYITGGAQGSVTILLGSKTGTFTVQPTTLTTCATPYGVAIGDFKHNGFSSVAVTCYTTSQLEIFPNNGNGTFGTPYMYTVGSSISGLTPNPASIALGDFNRDGKLDIVLGDTTANDISFFAGNGDNSFQASVESPSLNFPDSIVAGDFNGDGILDIAGVAPNFNAVELTLGVGDGTFGSIQQRAAGQLTAKTQPWALAAGDFNGDGTLDIVTANTYHQVNLNSPAYQFRFLGAYPAIPGGNPSVDVLINASAATITVTTSPSPVPANNSDVIVKASVQPALSGSTPTGSIIFEDSTGSELGTGPYPLNSGVATHNLGHLGSGTSFRFTSLYSGDSNYQPTTVSGSNGSFTVPGTPVTFSLSPSTVDYGNTFLATVTATGNTTTGSYPHGTATIYIDNGGTPIPVGTTGTFAQTGGFGSNNSRATVTIAATIANNLNVGSYELYAVFNPTSGAYTQGSSSDEPLTVAPPPTPTSTGISCSGGLFGGNCTSTTTVTATGLPVLTGNTVNFSATGGQTGTETTNAAGQAAWTYTGIFGNYTITASFPAQGTYAASSNTTSTFCFFICGLDRTGAGGGFNSLTLFGQFGQTNQPAPFRLF